MSVIAVDIDGVLADFCKGFGDYVALKTGRKRAEFTSPTTWDFWDQWSLSKDEFYQHFGIFGEWGGFGCCDLLPYAKKGLEVLRGQGHHTILATARGTERISAPAFKHKVQTDTLDWLHKHGIFFDEICFIGDKGLLRADVLIDDATHNLKRASQVGINGVCFNTSYNQDWEGCRIRDWTTVLDSQEFLPAVLGLSK